VNEIAQLIVDDEAPLADARIIMNYMNQFPDSVALQRVCCHAISNICMDLHKAQIMVGNYKAERPIIQALENFCSRDWRVCWLACSALWNMTRVQESRQEFSLHTINLLFEALRANQSTNCVVNTIIGSLSNLSLELGFKLYIGSESNHLLLLSVIEQTCDDMNVAATAAGLLANLAVSDEIAETLVKSGAIRLIKIMLQFNFRDAVFIRNIVAALSNLVTASIYVEECIRHFVIEELVHVVEHLIATDNLAIIGNCINALGIHDVNLQTTSYHIACLHGKNELLEKIIEQKVEQLDFNEQDNSGRTMLDYAIQGGNLDTVSFLLRCGCTIEACHNKKIPHTMSDVFRSTYRSIKNVEENFNSAVRSTTPMNSELANLVTGYISLYSKHKAATKITKSEIINSSSDLDLSQLGVEL